MSKITELIQKLCPEGVPFYPLWQVTIWDKKFQAVSKEKQTKVISYSYLLAADLFALESAGGDVFLLSTGEQTGWTTEELAGDNLAEGEVVTIPWGKSRPVVDCIKYYNGKFVTADNRIATSIDVNILNNKYLYYWLMSIGKEIDKLYRGAGIQHPNMGEVLDLCIPVPPLPVQQEIVRILDTFTAMNTNLEEELDARRKQLSFYREFLLPKEVSKDIASLTIGDVCKKICSGGTPTSTNRAYYGGDIPWLRTQEVDWKPIYATSEHITQEGYDSSSAKWIPANCVIVAMYGATAAKSAINRIPLTTNQACCNLEIDNKIAITEYVYFWLAKEYPNLKALGQGSQNNINAATIKNYPILLPPLHKQQEIVDCLRIFEKLTEIGDYSIAAELHKRKAQYEYYRDKLLTFKEA